MKRGSTSLKAEQTMDDAKKKEAVDEGQIWYGDLRVPQDAVPVAAGKEGRMRLTQRYVDALLSWEPEFLEDPDEYRAGLMERPRATFSLDYVESATKIQRDLVEQSKECVAHMESVRAWVRAELQEKGYVEVDEDYVARGVELRKAIEEDEEYAVAFGPMEGLVAEDK